MQRIRYQPQLSVTLAAFNATEQFDSTSPLVPGVLITGVEVNACSQVEELFSINPQLIRVEVYLCQVKPVDSTTARTGTLLLNTQVPTRFDAVTPADAAFAVINSYRGLNCRLPLHVEILSGSGVLAVVASTNTGTYTANFTFAIENPHGS